jgi:hypothetical protein
LPFVRVFQIEKGHKKEVLFNTNHISKIEVKYGVPSTYDTLLHAVPTDVGLTDENAVRCYEVHFGHDTMFIAANPDCPVVKIIEEIYTNAVKGKEEPPSKALLDSVVG